MNNQIQNVIHFDNFGDNVILVGQSIMARGYTSVYETIDLKQLESLNDKRNYIFLNVYNKHASVVLCDCVYFEKMFKKQPQFGKKFNTDDISPAAVSLKKFQSLTVSG